MAHELSFFAGLRACAGSRVGTLPPPLILKAKYSSQTARFRQKDLIPLGSGGGMHNNNQSDETMGGDATKGKGVTYEDEIELDGAGRL